MKTETKETGLPLHSTAEDDSVVTHKKKFQPSGSYIGLGIAIGAGVGVAIDNIAVGIGVGLAIGALLETRRKKLEGDA